MKTKISIKKVRIALSVAICASLSGWLMCQLILDPLINEPDPVVIKVDKFQGNIAAKSMVSNFNNLIKINVPLDKAMMWGDEAILLYSDYSPEIQIYKPYSNVCSAAFGYMEYNVHWDSNWKTGACVYDNQRKQLVFYPTFLWMNMFCVLAVIALLCVIVFGIIELLFRISFLLDK